WRRPTRRSARGFSRSCWPGSPRPSWWRWSRASRPGRGPRTWARARRRPNGRSAPLPPRLSRRERSPRRPCGRVAAHRPRATRAAPTTTYPTLPSARRSARASSSPVRSAPPGAAGRFEMSASRSGSRRRPAASRTTARVSGPTRTAATESRRRPRSRSSASRTSMSRTPTANTATCSSGGWSTSTTPAPGWTSRSRAMT
ncbi:MAG: hypothetical protein AVDCRST_MAG65-1880, partial [uncultured Solirubrobacteraceae bacterium]